MQENVLMLILSMIYDRNADKEPGKRFQDLNTVELIEKQGSSNFSKRRCINATFVQRPKPMK